MLVYSESFKGHSRKNWKIAVKVTYLGIRSNLGFDLVFKYVNTSDNPVDLITRGIPLDKFRSELQVWLTGPERLTGEDINCTHPSDLN